MLQEHACLCFDCRKRRRWEAADLPVTVLILVGAFVGRYDPWLAALFWIGYPVFRTYHLGSGPH